MGVFVGVAVGVFVGVDVGVLVGVAVGVSVGVAVGVSVGVAASSGQTIGLSIGLSIAHNEIGEMDGTANEVTAYIKNSNVTTDGNLTLSASSDSSINATVAATSVAVSLSLNNTGAALSGAGLEAKNDIATHVKAYIEGGSSIQVSGGEGISLTAEDRSKIFVDAQSHIALKRRIIRDKEERGYDLDDVLYRFEHHVMPAFERYLRPNRKDADLIVPNDVHFGNALRVIEGFIRWNLV